MAPYTENVMVARGTRQLQIMKASFFNEEDGDDAALNGYSHPHVVDRSTTTTPILQGSLLRGRLMASAKDFNHNEFKGMCLSEKSFHRSFVFPFKTRVMAFA